LEVRKEAAAIINEPKLSMGGIKVRLWQTSGYPMA
jgi:hypothetical protein